MPYEIKSSGKGKKLVLKKSGKVLGRHPSRASAQRQIAAIEISKQRRAGKHIPKPR